MNKIVVLSDTHQNQILLRKVLENENDYNYVFHLGDDYEDLDENLDLITNKNITKVPGIFHPGYKDGSLEKIKQVIINGWSFLLTHNIEDFENTDQIADFYLFGHTHHYNFEEYQKSYYLNPGHLKDDNHRGKEPSYVIILVNKAEINIQFNRIDGSTFYSKKIMKNM